MNFESALELSDVVRLKDGKEFRIQWVDVDNKEVGLIDSKDNELYLDIDDPVFENCILLKLEEFEWQNA